MSVILLRPALQSSKLLPPLASRSITLLPLTCRAGIHTSRSRFEPSTALRPGVKEREEERGVKVVGREAKGSEGPHYKDQIQMAANASPLTDEMKTGGWTLMNPIYTESELDLVKVVHHVPGSVSEKLAFGAVKLARRIFDWVSRYKDYKIPENVLAMKPIPVENLRAEGKLLSPKQWLVRILFLESIAGVPGMVAGTLRHLRSLRLMRRDGGWIHTLLEEAENERMHLLTFITVAQPTLLTRALILGAQGVFYNLFFLAYLLSPKTAHRFVGFLEEEAVYTYTHCIEDIERGLIPEWKDVPAPRIAIDYWRLPENAKLLDVIRAVRADEATHRFVNHSLANLDQKRDFNPFALAEASPELRGTKPGFSRDESAAFAKGSFEDQERKRIGEPAH